jgi:thiamine kinase-like enzyme
MFIEKKSIDTYLGLLPDEVLDALLKKFGFDETWIVLPFLNVNGKEVAINRRSETAKKAIILYQERFFILKEIPWYCSNAEFVQYELSYQVELFKRNFPIPQIQKTIVGNLFTEFTYDKTEKYFFLQEFIVGNSWDGNIKKLQNTAKSLACLHNNSLATEKNLNATIPVGNVFSLAEKMVNVINDVLTDKSKQVANVDLEKLRAFSSYANEKIAIANAGAQKKGYNEIAFPIHGDFNPWNLIYSNSHEIIGVVDFDNSIKDNPVHDLAETILDFCFFTFRNQKTRLSGVPTTLNESICKEILQSYYDEADKTLAKTIEYLEEAAMAISIELFALGIVRGDYNFNDCASFVLANDKMFEDLKIIKMKIQIK